MRKRVKKWLPMNLQFFAEDTFKNDDGEDKSNIGDDGTGDAADDDSSDDQKKSEKKFTQSEVSAIAAKEKKEARKALLKQLGFKSESEALSAMKLYSALLDSQKSDDEKKEEKLKGLEDDKTEAEKRAEVAEEKLACVIAGVNKDSLDDVLAIAKLKVTDEKGLDKVLSEMKADTRYKSFFGESDNDSTGGNPGHSGQGGGKEKGQLGKELAQRSDKGEEKKKKSYFD